MYNSIPNYETNHQKQISVYFDNATFNPSNYELSKENYDSRLKVELTLSDFEFGLFSKYIKNISLITILKQIKKNRLTRKQKQKTLLHANKTMNCSFREFNALKRMRIINLLENPYQNFLINGEKVRIVNIERILYQTGLSEYRIIGELNNY